ncbi:MAG: outer membrane beta-barrel protein, partial [bacterium]
MSICIFPVMGQNARAPIDEGSILIQPLSLGVFGFGGFNVHTASFSGFRGTPSCCPEYTLATSLGGSFGILGQYAIDSQFGVGMRMGFNGLGGDFSSEEIQYVMSQTGFATITHSMETSLGILSLEPQGIYKIEKANIFGGLWLGFPLAMQFSQRESIFPGTFDGLNRIRNEISGDIPGTPSILFGISGGVSYELPMNVAGNIRLAPEVRGFANFNEFSESTHWKAFGIRVGASLLWSPIVNIPPPPPPPPIIIKPLPELLTNIF